MKGYYFHQGPRVPDPASPDGRCTHCGHAVPATCTICHREMICGEAGEPCTADGCQEKRLRNPEHDLKTCTTEKPRMYFPRWGRLRLAGDNMSDEQEDPQKIRAERDIYRQALADIYTGRLGAGELYDDHMVVDAIDKRVHRALFVDTTPPPEGYP